MRPNGGVTLEPAVRGDMGRVEGCKVASGGQLVEAGIHRWGGRALGLLVYMNNSLFVNVNIMGQI